MIRLLTILCLTFMTLLSGATLATAKTPDNFPVEISKPDNWKDEDLSDKDPRVVVFTNPENESRIEVYKQPLTRATHSTILIDAFKKNLIKENLSEVSEKKVYEFELTNGQKRTGVYSEYEYSDSDVPITVLTYAFTVEGEQTMLIFVVGYFAVNMDKEKAQADFESFVRNILNKPQKDQV